MNAHDAEYAAAVAGMADHTMPPAVPQEPAVGDYVSGVTDGRSWSGHVEWVEGDHMCIKNGGSWDSVPLKDIRFLKDRLPSETACGRSGAEHQQQGRTITR